MEMRRKLHICTWMFLVHENTRQVLIRKCCCNAQNITAYFPSASFHTHSKEQLSGSWGKRHQMGLVAEEPWPSNCTCHASEPTSRPAFIHCFLWFVLNANRKLTKKFSIVNLRGLISYFFLIFKSTKHKPAMGWFLFIKNIYFLK